MICSLVGWLVVGAPLLAPPEPPKREFARGIVLVDLRVNDAPGWALVDTGSPYTYVDSALREELCGASDPLDRKPPAKTVEAKLWIGSRLSVKQTVRFLDLSPFDGASARRPLIAILGRDLLGGYALGVDLKRSMMKLWKGGKVPAEAVRRWSEGKERGGIGIDVRVDHVGAGGSGIAALDVGVDGASGAWALSCRPGEAEAIPLHFDTGSTFTSIHWKLLQPLGLKPARTETVADVFGATARRVMVLPVLRIGVLSLANVEVFAEDEGVEADVLAPKDLGVAWYVLDPAAGKLYVPTA